MGFRASQWTQDITLMALCDAVSLSVRLLILTLIIILVTAIRNRIVQSL